MAYEPTTWNNDDVITAEKLNKLEQGVKNEQVGPAGPAGAKGEQGIQGPAAGSYTNLTLPTKREGESIVVADE